MSSFLGMRGNGDWVTDQRPKNWRETILFLYPNGSMPLTAIMSKMKSEKTDDPSFIGGRSCCLLRLQRLLVFILTLV
jgi:hypothetical protein